MLEFKKKDLLVGSFQSRVKGGGADRVVHLYYCIFLMLLRNPNCQYETRPFVLDVYFFSLPWKHKVPLYGLLFPQNSIFLFLNLQVCLHWLRRGGSYLSISQQGLWAGHVQDPNHSSTRVCHYLKLEGFRSNFVSYFYFDWKLLSVFTTANKFSYHFLLIYLLHLWTLIFSISNIHRILSLHAHP